MHTRGSLLASVWPLSGTGKGYWQCWTIHLPSLLPADQQKSYLEPHLYSARPRRSLLLPASDTSLPPATPASILGSWGSHLSTALSSQPTSVAVGRCGVGWLMSTGGWDPTSSSACVHVLAVVGSCQLCNISGLQCVCRWRQDIYGDLGESYHPGWRKSLPWPVGTCQFGQGWVWLSCPIYILLFPSISMSLAIGRPAFSASVHWRSQIHTWYTQIQKSKCAKAPSWAAMGTIVL